MLDAGCWRLPTANLPSPDDRNAARFLSFCPLSGDDLPFVSYAEDVNAHGQVGSCPGFAVPAVIGVLGLENHLPPTVEDLQFEIQERTIGVNLEGIVDIIVVGGERIRG